MDRSPFVAGLAILAASSSCASTHLATEWRNPEDEGGALGRILVVAPNARSKADRIQFEIRLASELSARSAGEATSMFAVDPDADELDQDEVERVVRDGGFDGVLVVGLLGIRQKVEVTSVPTAYGWGWDRWYRAYYFAGRQDRVSVYDVISLEVSLHRLPGFDLAWTARTESVDVDSPEELAEELSDVLVPELRETGLLEPAN